MSRVIGAVTKVRIEKREGLDWDEVRIEVERGELPGEVVVLQGQRWREERGGIEVEVVKQARCSMTPVADEGDCQDFRPDLIAPSHAKPEEKP